MALHIVGTGTRTDNLWIIAQCLILDYAIDDIQPKPIDSLVQPKGKLIKNRFNRLGTPPIEVGLIRKK
jgi:hypothetical protein